MRLPDLLQARRGDILAAWEHEVRALLPAAGPSRPVLRDHVPGLLDRLAARLEASPAAAEASLATAGDADAPGRLPEGFDLRQVTAEYQLLRACVLRRWAADAPSEASLRDVIALDDAIDRAVADAVVHADLAARHRAEEELRRLSDEAHALLATLDAFLSSAPVGFAVIDRDLRYVRINEFLARLNGMPVEAHLGRTVGELLPQVREFVEPLLRGVLESGRAVVGLEADVESPRGSGAVLHVVANYLPLRDAAGAVYAIGGTVIDLTEATRTAEALRREAAFRERFMGILGHDLRTPLSAVTIGADTLLRGGGLDAPQARSVERIARSARRMERMIRDLLDFARSRHGAGVPLAPVPTDLGQLCRQVLDELEASHPTRALRLEREGDARGVWDPDRLMQVVSNLAGNALRYSLLDTPVIVRVRGAAGLVSVSVTNQGRPIPSEERGTLFDPFRRGAGEGVGEGLGLGLYITDVVVRAHGGAVVVESDAHETTFTVTLPRVGSGFTGP